MSSPSPTANVAQSAVAHRRCVSQEIERPGPKCPKFTTSFALPLHLAPRVNVAGNSRNKGSNSSTAAGLAARCGRAVASFVSAVSRDVDSGGEVEWQSKRGGELWTFWSRPFDLLRDAAPVGHSRLGHICRR